MEPRFQMENLPKHLCATCKFMNKCRRVKTVHEQLSEVEADALEKWKMDLDVSYMIRECDLYAIDWDLVNMMNGFGGIQIEIIDWDDTEEEE